MKEPPITNPTGGVKPVHLEYARSFLKASMILDQASTGLADDGPIYHLSATGLELTLKALLSLLGRTDAAVRHFGHGLSALYNAAMLDAQGCAMIQNAERSSRQKWKAFLKEMRGEYLAQLMSGKISSQLSVPSNAVIGNSLPRFCDAVSWLDARHKNAGGQFRYVKRGPDQRPYILEFDLQKRIIPQSTYWVCVHILEQIDAALSDARKHSVHAEEAIIYAVKQTIKTPSRCRFSAPPPPAPSKA